MAAGLGLPEAGLWKSSFCKLSSPSESFSQVMTPVPSLSLADTKKRRVVCRPWFTTRWVGSDVCAEMRGGKRRVREVFKM